MRPLAVAALTVAALGVPLYALVRPDPPAPRPAPVQPRITYPANRAPTLTLPDGERKTIHSLLNVRRPLRYGDWVWNEASVPAGPAWVRVDLAHQTLSVFRAGHEIGAAIIVYGADGTLTPGGVFPILEKAREHQSTLYEAEMPYMLRLTRDGVAIHASDVRFGHATHGCVGLPPAFAAKLFDQMKPGDPVAILPAA